MVYLHPDHLGTPRILTDSFGTTLETHVYFPFGQEATTPTNSEVLQFTGHERDDYDAGPRRRSTWTTCMQGTTARTSGDS